MRIPGIDVKLENGKWHIRNETGGDGRLFYAITGDNPGADWGLVMKEDVRWGIEDMRCAGLADPAIIRWLPGIDKNRPLLRTVHARMCDSTRMACALTRELDREIS